MGKPRVREGQSLALGPGPKESVGDILAVQGGSTAPLGLLHHGGLVAQGDANAGGGELAGLAIHLHWDGLGRGEHHLAALRQPLAVPTHLQRCLWAQKAQVRGRGQVEGPGEALAKEIERDPDRKWREGETQTRRGGEGKIQTETRRVFPQRLMEAFFQAQREEVTVSPLQRRGLVTPLPSFWAVSQGQVQSRAGDPGRPHAGLLTRDVMVKPMTSR